MKFIIALIILFVSLQPLGATQKIAVADLAMLASLHPKMALFDFERLGFYRLPLGLSESEWQIKLKIAKQISPARYKQLMKKRTEASKKIEKINAEIRAIMNSPIGKANDFHTKSKCLQDLSRAENICRSTIKECDYQINCPELTSLSETRKILSEIDSEIMTIIKKIANNGDFLLVLNASTPASYGFPTKYETGEMYGVGLPGIDTHLLYSFIANEDHVLSSDTTPESLKMIHWLELTSYPECQNLLPIRPYPLVLSGGVHIEKEVIREIYKKNKIDEEVIKATCAVIDSINQHRADFQTEIPVFNKTR